MITLLSTLRAATPQLGARPPRRALVSAVAVMLVSACAEASPNAYGNFEATEVAVSAQTGGPLLTFGVQEGDVLVAGAEVATVDTLQAALQRDELAVAAATARVHRAEAQAQIRVLEAQLSPAREDLSRLERLAEVEAATAQQLTRARGQVDVLEEQISAARLRIQLADQEAQAVDSRVRQVADQIGRGTVINPVAGTVLRSFVQEGEVVQPGRPLYTIANLDTLILRAWVTSRQLGALRVGQDVTVQFDAVEGAESSFESRPGRITWIAAKAEFTPTPIQTRDERVDQVYAIKITVENADGRLKIGMPGELILVSAEGAPRP